MIKNSINITALVMMTFISFNHSSLAETRIGLKSFQINQETKIEITSETMVFNSKTFVTRFSTDVKLNYGKLKLSAQVLDVSPSTNNSNLTFFASGPIVISSGKNFIYGDQANFKEKNQELVITGNVSLVQNNNKIFGNELILDLKEGIAKISGEVKTTISPSEKNLK
jgi:lipopolysaccharide transport protein LptA